MTEEEQSQTGVFKREHEETASREIIVDEENDTDITAEELATDEMAPDDPQQTIGKLSGLDAMILSFNCFPFNFP